jgi:hypothetical protein
MGIAEMNSVLLMKLKNDTLVMRMRLVAVKRARQNRVAKTTASTLIRAFLVDKDSGSIEEMRDWTLPPSVIVQTTDSSR